MLIKRYIIVLFFLLSCNQNMILADCHTGFACSIAELEKQEKEKNELIIEFIKKYKIQQNMAELSPIRQEIYNQININPEIQYFNKEYYGKKNVPAKFSPTHLSYCKNFVIRENNLLSSSSKYF